MIISRQKVFWLLAVTIITLKFMTLWHFGPIYSPDSDGYVSFADSILSLGEWVHSINLDVSGHPGTAFRSIGYPAIIAIFKLISPTYFDWFLITFQSILSLVASFYIYNLSYAMFKKFPLAAFCGIAHAVGLGGVLDLSILTDSLNANLIIIIICIASRGLLKEIQPTYFVMFGLGLFLAFSFLIREAGAVLQYLLWPIVLYWLLKQHRYLLKTALLFTLFIGPIFITSYFYKSWNEYRSGERFVTTAAQTTVYFPAFKIYAKDILPYEYNDILRDIPLTSDIVRSQTPMENVWVVNRYLFEKHNMNAIERARYGYKVFFELWQEHPLLMLTVTLKNIRGKIGALAFQPIETYITMAYWSTWDLAARPYAGSKDLIKKVKEDERYDLLMLYLVQSLCRLISMLIFIVFVIGSPIIILRRLCKSSRKIKMLDTPTGLTGLFWVLFMGYTFAYALVHLELRYVLPVVPFGMIAGLFVLENCRTYFKNRKQSESV